MSSGTASIDPGTVPNTLATVPGSLYAFNRLVRIEAAIALLPDFFIDSVRRNVIDGTRIVYFIDADHITDANGTLSLQAMVKVIE